MKIVIKSLKLIVAIITFLDIRLINCNYSKNSNRNLLKESIANKVKEANKESIANKAKEANKESGKLKEGINLELELEKHRMKMRHRKRVNYKINTYHI